MPTVISTSSFSVTFDLTATPGTFVLKDTFNYSAAGIPLAGTSVLDCFTITAPDGNVFYNNNTFASPGADIVVPSGTTNVNTIYLPVLPSGAPVPGVYTIVMTTQITDGVHPPYFVTTTNTINFTFVAPTVHINQTVDCIGANFTSSDITDYVVGGVAPVVVRTHTISVPGSVPPAPAPTVITGTTPIINLTSGQFYNGLQVTTISSLCTWTFPDGSIVVATVKGSKSIAVDCTYFCAIYCCLRSINNNIKKYKGVNDMLANEYEATFAKVMGLVELATLAYSCGKSKDVAGYVLQIQQLADCTDDCSCQDGAPSPVYGLGGGGTGVDVQIQSCNPGITVTSVLNGNTKTWTICLDPSFLTKINGLMNTVVVAGNSTVTVTPSGPVPVLGIPTMTYSVVSNVAATELCAFTAVINYSTYPLTKISIGNAQASGSLLKNTISATATNLVNPNFSKISNEFEITGFLNTIPVGVRYKVVATPVGWIGRNGAPYTMVANVKSVTISSNGTIKFSMAIIGASGNGIISHGELSDLTGSVHFIITTY